MSRLIDEIKNMSPEEKAELSAALKDLEQKPEPEARMIGEPMKDPRAHDRFGNSLTPEQIWDQEHSLLLRPYGFSETVAEFGKAAKKKYWTNEQVDAYNLEMKKKWLDAKRKVFPNAVLPDLDY